MIHAAVFAGCFLLCVTFLTVLVGWPDTDSIGDFTAHRIGLTMFGTPSLAMLLGALAASQATRALGAGRVTQIISSILLGAILFYLGGVFGLSWAIFMSGDF